MKTRTVRAILALLVVGVFMAISGVIALYPLFSRTNVDLDPYANFFNKTASVYTGIVGVIVGYYFGRSDNGPTPAAATPDHPHASDLPSPPPPDKG
jgi:uncharacterized membrane protein HdeD (DUF308 family)